MLVRLIAAALLWGLCAGIGATARADVKVAAGNDCIDAADVRARLAAVVATRVGDPSEVAVHVDSSATGRHETTVTLRVATRVGRVVLDRKFVLAPSDCASAAELLTLVLDRFLTRLPVDQWNEHPLRPAGMPPIVVRDPAQSPRSRAGSGLEVALVSAVGIAGRVDGVDVELGLRFDVGHPCWRFGGGALVRQGQEAEFGGAEVATRFALATSGVRYAGRGWQGAVELRGGAVQLIGIVPGRPPAFPWAELAGSLSWVWRHASVGLVLSGSPVSDRVVWVNSVSQMLEIPEFRIGLGVSVPLLGQNR
jgi:hypothetical protein